MDLFLLFPEYLQSFSFQGMAERRTELRLLELRKARDSFVSLPDVRTVYRELETYQKVSLTRMVAKGIFSKAAFDAGDAELVLDRVPASLLLVLEDSAGRYSDQISFMYEVFAGMAVDGTEGLFRRTGIDVPGRFR